MAMPLNGRKLGLEIREKVAKRVKTLPSRPGLGVILVGNDPASHLYVSLKRQACEAAGIAFELHLYPSDTPESDLIAKIEELNARGEINGILVQLPLPSQDPDSIIASIDPLKDVDGFHPVNLQRLREGKPAIASAVALAIMKLIDEALKTYPAGKVKTACVVSSELFADPLVTLLSNRHIQPTVIQAESYKLAEATKAADIVIVAEGIPGLINGEMVKPGSIVIDVGTTRTDKGLRGDIEHESVNKIAGALTPVPGGVGPMTVAMLLANILKAYDLQRKA